MPAGLTACREGGPSSFPIISFGDGSPRAGGCCLGCQGTCSVSQSVCWDTASGRFWGQGQASGTQATVLLHSSAVFLRGAEGLCHLPSRWGHQKPLSHQAAGLLLGTGPGHSVWSEPALSAAWAMPGLSTQGPATPPPPGPRKDPAQTAPDSHSSSGCPDSRAGGQASPRSCPPLPATPSGPPDPECWLRGWERTELWVLRAIEVSVGFAGTRSP